MSDAENIPVPVELSFDIVKVQADEIWELIKPQWERLKPQIDGVMAEFNAQAKTIRPEELAKEALRYMIDRVEDYLDNRVTIFRLYFVREAEFEGMPEMLRLFRLYQTIPEVVEGHPLENTAAAAMACLHAVTHKVKDKMNAEKDMLAELFERLIIYYDTKLRRSGENLVPITYDLEGYVHVSLFDYEAFTMRTEVVRGQAKGDQPVQGAEKIKDIVIPEGFAIEFSLQFWPKTMTTSVGI